MKIVSSKVVEGSKSANSNSPNNLGISGELLDTLVESISNTMYLAGYDVDMSVVDGQVLLSTSYRNSTEGQYMPEIKLTLQRIDNNIYCIPYLTFPDLTMTSEDYYDDIEHWLSEWKKVGKYMTELCRYWFDIDAYSAED